METRDKFTFQFPIALSHDDLTPLCTHLSALLTKPQDDTAVFLVVNISKSGKRRLVLKSNPTYGNLVLLHQTAKEKILEKEPKFNDVGIIDFISDEEDEHVICQNYEDEKFSQFSFHKIDKLDAVVKRMRTYLQHLTINKVASSQLQEATSSGKKTGKRGKKQQSSSSTNRKRVKKVESEEEEEMELPVVSPPLPVPSSSPPSAFDFPPPGSILPPGCDPFIGTISPSVSDENTKKN